MTYYAADGSVNVTVVAGNTYTGKYAVDGSLNVIASPGGSYVGRHHSCGATYVTARSTLSNSPIAAPDGSLFVTNTGMPAKNAGQPVTVVTGVLTFT